ncbi:protein singed wings 2 [Drosophila grimshawi]|uniref:GH20542 n=1 Tax=Drosophila grimshawi TaxID=7222 RepID=B4J8L4_DROGR|nr:protein singed wings 2 [Drosophila grimshawi]EDW01281.1 GH20542 [Drosophila grimshawi]
MAMSYRVIYFDGSPFVICLCLLLVIFGRYCGAADPSDGLTTLTTTSTSVAPLAALPALVQSPTHSCVNWTAAPEAADGNCTRSTGTGLIQCYGGMNNLAVLNSKLGKVFPAQQMLLCGWPKVDFNPLGELLKFPKLRSLTIEYSGFIKFALDFPDMNQLQAINISWTNLSHISARTFKRLHALQVLDLRWNQLIQLDGPLILPRSFQQLYLAGNPWNCTRNFKWILLQPEKGRLVADREELICTDRKYKERQMILVMHYKVVLRRECQSHVDLLNCTCLMHHIIPKSYIPLYTVNCSHLQFYSLPAYLPPNTTSLYITDNQISDINPLRDNPHYKHVVDVQLENNRISNIDVLEDTYWLENFRLLNLHGNQLQKLQVYALDNALNDNLNVNLLLLSKNPWHCTCKFGMRLRELLTKYKDIVRDARNVTCTYMQGDEMRRAQVLSLTRHDMCNITVEDDMRIHPIDWLNCVLASLIFLILGKLAYDYYFYRFHGRVPWIVMNMP